MKTLIFVLRWHGLTFLGGIALMDMSAYGLYTIQPDAPSKAYVSAASMLGRPAYFIGLLIGFAMTAWAWWKGTRLTLGL